MKDGPGERHAVSFGRSELGEQFFRAQLLPRAREQPGKSSDRPRFEGRQRMHFFKTADRFTCLSPSEERLTQCQPAEMEVLLEFQDVARFLLCFLGSASRL